VEKRKIFAQQAADRLQQQQQQQSTTFDETHSTFKGNGEETMLLESIEVENIQM
jgi:hypothetical protein